MSDTVIRVENLGKKYIIGHQQQERYTSLRDVITNKVKSIGSLINPKVKNENSAFEEFWALKDVSFDIKQGDRVGIIGRNGAGKSTLLKILSRITEPTTGSIKIKGRVASLLEVGTGFHPELTGRENIFLNGAILGMGKEEIKRKFDEIVAFAEVEKFLDTPVKRYSSGMYVRLAFAVAAHLEPEILIVDEVLAVGDAQFQKKCLGKMEDVGKEGRTVIFVSHNMSAITSLCNTGLFLKAGCLIDFSDINYVVSKYLSYSGSLVSSYSNQQKFYEKKLFISSINLVKENILSEVFYNSETLVVRIDYVVNHKIKGFQIALEVFTELNECLFSTTSQDWNCQKKEIQPGFYKIECPINLSFFRSGRYFIQVSSSIPAVEVLDIVSDRLSFEVYDDSSPIFKLGQNRKGIIMPIIQWRENNETTN